MKDLVKVLACSCALGLIVGSCEELQGTKIHGTGFGIVSRVGAGVQHAPGGRTKIETKSVLDEHVEAIGRLIRGGSVSVDKLFKGMDQCEKRFAKNKDVQNVDELKNIATLALLDAGCLMTGFLPSCDEKNGGCYEMLAGKGLSLLRMLSRRFEGSLEWNGCLFGACDQWNAGVKQILEIAVRSRRVNQTVLNAMSKRLEETMELAEELLNEAREQCQKPQEKNEKETETTAVDYFSGVDGLMSKILAPLFSEGEGEGEGGLGG